MKLHALTGVVSHRSSSACPASSAPCIRTQRFMVSSLTPTVDTKNPLAQIPPPSQYTLARKPNFARSARLVLLFSMFTTLLTLYRGGISMCRCTWSLSTPDRREVPVRIVLAHFVQFYSEVTCYSWGQN